MYISEIIIKERKISKIETEKAYSGYNTYLFLCFKYNSVISFITLLLQALATVSKPPEGIRNT